MKEYQRKQLLERVNREAATIGTEIPESVEIRGEEIDLRSFVFEIKRRETIPPGERDRVDRAKRNLRRERRARLRTIESGEVSFEEGDRLADSIVGIDRALEALETLRPADIEAEAARQEAADRQRWMRFLRKALGRDERSGPRGRGRS